MHTPIPCGNLYRMSQMENPTSPARLMGSMKRLVVVSLDAFKSIGRATVLCKRMMASLLTKGGAI